LNIFEKQYNYIVIRTVPLPGELVPTFFGRRIEETKKFRKPGWVVQ